MATFSSGTNLVMTVIGFAVSAMFIVFVCTRLICARIQLTASRRSFNASSLSAVATGSDLSILERGIHHGLETSLVANFPTKNFSDHLFSSGRQDIQCTICLAEFQENDVLRILPCEHTFHVTCIDLWLKQNSTCPVCRTSLRYSDRKHRMQPIYSTAIRPSYPREMFNSESYQSPQPDQLYSAGTMDDQRMDSTVRDELISEPSGAREMASTEANCSAKTVCPNEAGEKYKESPSNP